jgi:dolichol-phosphate mannosyltransferase
MKFRSAQDDNHSMDLRNSILDASAARPAHKNGADVQTLVNDRKLSPESGVKPVELSLVIPTYNERENIASLVRSIHQLLTDSGCSFEIIIVDDDSPDKTWELVQTLTAKYPGLRLIRRIKEKGLAKAVTRGWQEARGEILAVMDGDLQHPPETLLTLIEALRKDGIEIAVASRHVQGGGVSDWNVFRRLISWSATLTATWILPGTLATVRDPMSGFFALRRSVIDGIPLNPTGYKILLEVLSRGTYASVEEVPYTFVERKQGGSKFGLRQALEFLGHLARLSWTTGELTRLLQYLTVGLSGVLVNMGTLFVLTFQGWSYISAGILAVESSILTNFLLNEIWTFADFSRRSASLGARLQRLFKYNLVCVGGAIINLALLWLMTEHVGIYFMLSNGIGIIAATLWNYGMNANVTWESARARRRVKAQGSSPAVEEVWTGREASTAKIWLGTATLWLQFVITVFFFLEVGRSIQTPFSKWASRAIDLLSSW